LQLNSDKFLQQIDFIRLEANKSLHPMHQSELGQFLTPPAVAKLMSSMFVDIKDDFSIVDAGAGVGTLTAAFLAYVCGLEKKPSNIFARLYEIDPIMIRGIEKTIAICTDLCNQNNIHLKYEIKQEDFIVSSVNQIKAYGSFFPGEGNFYNYAILNPPYHKINSDSKEQHLLTSIGIKTTNLYTAFLWLIIIQLSMKGELVAIVPRSFCNGTYYRPFRVELLKEMAIQRLHIFESRTLAFKEGNVLQENIIIHAQKTLRKPSKITVSSSIGPDDEDVMIREVDYQQVVQPDDRDVFIRIVPDKLGHNINRLVDKLTTTIRDLGLGVSTGKVVEYRSKHLLCKDPINDGIPLIFPNNLSATGTICWPNLKSRKSTSMVNNPEALNLVIPSRIYVLVKRFSSKEEKRRVSAAFYNPDQFRSTLLGIENHINYFHSRYGEISINLAKGLTLFLNSTLVDQYFRQFSGHTQVNAADLRSLKYPTNDQLISMGKCWEINLPDQDNIDKILKEELALDNNDLDLDITDPILAKKRIKDALRILHLFNLPRAQQNDRSALSLLSLLNIKPDTLWKDASPNLIGITEMMTFFKDYYGINYAPNTRETVRRQTVHQFIQIGLVIPNPDMPLRPINSPNTRYQIEPGAIKLIQSYGSVDWDGNYRQYMKTSTEIARLQLRERAMTLIPVTMPDGVELTLTAGSHNELIKKIIESFCPRFTPGGKVIYVGDTGSKLNEHEQHYFKNLDINIDKHGKMPDIVIYLAEKNWLVLIEAVTSHGPIDKKRHNELSSLFTGTKYSLVYITAFETRKTMLKYLSEIDWETEVWVAESPSHLIHFDGQKFLGPYET
jgi:adenine-specific DNA-methyltransferase